MVALQLRRSSVGRVVIALTENENIAFFGLLGVVLTAGATLIGVIYQARKTRSRLDTGNGRDIGTTVHDSAQLQEVLSAQVHTNTKELLSMSMSVTTLAERIERLAERLDRHMDEVQPVLEKAEALVEEYEQIILPFVQSQMEEEE